MSTAQFIHGIEMKEVKNGARPIQGLSSSIIGIVGTAPTADSNLFPIGIPVLISGSRKEAAGLDTTTDGTGGGTLLPAINGAFDQIGVTVVVIRVEQLETDEAQIAAIVAAIPTFLEAEHETGFKPKLLIAPGYTDIKGVAEALASVAGKLRGVVIAEGPDTTDAAAIAYAGDFGSDRVYVVDPMSRALVNGVDTPENISGRVAGLFAYVDYTEGVQCSPSNHELRGVIGTTRPVPFINGDPTSRANMLNEKNVATVIRQNGFRLWGNRSTSADPKYRFICVRRVSDLIAEAIQRSMLWAVDKPVNKALFDAVADSVNAYLRSLTVEGVILGGECWYDREENSNTDLAAGVVRFRYKFTAPAPAENMIFGGELVDDYYDVIFTK